MKRGLIVAALFILIVLIDWLYFITDALVGHPFRYGILYFLIVSTLVFSILSILAYKKFYDFNSSKIKLSLFIIIPLCLSMFVANRMLAVNKYYNYAKTVNLSRNLWESDKYLAHRGRPNAVGYYGYSIGDSIFGTIEVRFDSLGYRTSLNHDKLSSEKLDLYLGCSFTFGDFITAEEGFPFKTSELIGHNFINAGASAYGIGQMKQLLDSLLDKYEFEYVFIQLSPWLADRAMKMNGPTYFGYRPFPYFSDKEDGFDLNYPAYKTRMYESKNWFLTKKTYKEKIIFSFTEGINIELLDYLSYKFAQIKIFLKIIPAPTKRKSELEKYFYSYAVNEAKEHNATPVLLKLQYPREQCNEVLNNIRGQVDVIDLDSALEEVLDTSSQNYSEQFTIYHLHNGVKLYFDPHLNNYANGIVANFIFNHLKTE